MSPSRRSFLKAASLAPLAAWSYPPSPSAQRPAPSASSAFDPWVEIHAANLRHNVAEVRRRAGGRPILAVIKNNGYGAGVANVARVLDPLDAIAGLAVVKLQEAVTLRDTGIRKPILLLGPLDERDLEDAVARDITPMVYTPIGARLDRVAAKRGRPVRIQSLQQVATAPPTFLLRANMPKLHFAFERFLVNQLRQRFGFFGTPIRLRLTARKRRRV